MPYSKQSLFVLRFIRKKYVNTLCRPDVYFFVLILNLFVHKVTTRLYGLNIQIGENGIGRCFHTLSDEHVLCTPGETRLFLFSQDVRNCKWRWGGFRYRTGTCLELC
jgi:hypothetical protein